MTMPHVDADRFWQKVRDTAGKLPFVDQVVAVWYCALDPLTPTRVKATLLGAVAYFVLPVDLVPDWLAGLGFTDDFAVLMAAIKAVRPWITDDHLQRAREALRVSQDPVA